MPEGKPVNLEQAFPLSGIDTSTAFHAQRPGTCVDGLNVRSFEPSTDRARGGSRPGLAKFLDEQVSGSNAIQSLDYYVVSQQELVGDGVSWCQGDTGSGMVAQLRDVSGNTAYTWPYSAAAMSFFFDQESNGYVAGATAATTVRVTKVSAAGVSQWDVSLTVPTSSIVRGIVVFDGVVYVFMTSATGPTSRLFRLDAETGENLDASSWKSNADGLTTEATGSKRMAIQNGVIAISTATGETVQFWTTAGSLVATSAAFGATASNITADAAGFFYVCVGSGVGVKKLDPTGTVLWTAAGSVNDVSYDPAAGVLAAVGSGNTLGSSSSFCKVNATTGVVIAGSGSNPNSATDWILVAADGRGGFRLARNATTNNFAAIDSSSTLTWIKSTGDAMSGTEAIASTGYAEPGDIMVGGRVIRGVAVAGGTVKRFDPDGFTSVTNGTVALRADATVIFSQQIGLFMYFVDGMQFKRLNIVDDAMELWTPTAGSLPVSITQETPRLICLWRGRCVLSGLRYEPQNWFMSAVDNPLDWDYSPLSQTPTQAVAGNNSSAGLVGDIVNCMIPFSDDILYFLCDHSIYMMSGDPMAGGQIDRVTDVIGGAWGRPWCKGPDGTVFFFSSRGAVFYMVPGQQPQRLSAQNSDQLAKVNVGTNIIRMAWDDLMQGLHLFITPLDASEEAQHWVWEQRVNAWWPVEFGRTAYNPRAVCVFDGDSPDDRVLLMGGTDGYIRQYLNSATTDDGYSFTASVTVGPFIAPNMAAVFLYEAQAELATASAPVTYAIYRGQSAEEALSTEPIETGTWSPDRNFTNGLRWAGYAFYIKISSTDRWSIERFRLKAGYRGGPRGRSR